MNRIIQEILSVKKLPVLIALLVIFVLRVVSQLVQYMFDLRFFPSFSKLHSGFVSYEILLVMQTIIILIFIKTIYKIYTTRIQLSTKRGYGLIVSGSLYFCFMLFRFIAGLTFLKNVNWFAYPIPSFFHMVLALFLIILGFYFLSETRVSKND